MQQGTVTWFSGHKGYGFIAPDDGSGDVFVHHSDIGELALLEQTQRVQFDSVEGDRGPRAQNVRPA